MNRQRRGELLTDHDAAIVAGVQPATIRDWRRRGLLTRYGTRGAALVDVDELAKALASTDQARCRDCASARLVGAVGDMVSSGQVVRCPRHAVRRAG